MSYYKKYALTAVALALAFSMGRFSSTLTNERTTEKSSKQTDQVTNKDQNVTEDTKETRLPDGTIITETHKEKETQTHAEVKRSSQTEKDVSKTYETRPSYRLGVAYQPPIKGFQETSYSLIVEKRLVSELYIGVLSNLNEKTLAVTLSFGF